MTAPLLAVDAPSLYFRAYFGVPESSAQTASGQPTPLTAVADGSEDAAWIWARILAIAAWIVGSIVVGSITLRRRTP